MPRLAANLSTMFTEVPFLRRFGLAAENGFDAVEFQFPYDHDAGSIARALGDTGQTAVLFNLSPGDWQNGERGLAALPDRREEFRASVDEALRYAAVLGVSRLHVMSGRADPADPAARRTYEDSLRLAANKAGERGIQMMIEPINPRDMPGYFLRDFNLAADLIAGLALPNLRLQFDIYHRQIIHGDVTRGLRSLMPLIGHVQIASVPERAEPGTGELDDARLLRELDALGYAGFVGCEYRPSAGTVAGLGWREALGTGRPPA